MKRLSRRERGCALILAAAVVAVGLGACTQDIKTTAQARDRCEAAGGVFKVYEDDFGRWFCDLSTDAEKSDGSE